MSVEFGGALRLLPGRIFHGRTATHAILQSMLTQFTILVVNFATGVLTARLLGPEGRGIFAAVVLWPQLLSSLAVAGLADNTSYHVAKMPERRTSIFFGSLLVSMILAIFVVAAFQVVIPKVISGYDAQVVMVARLASLATFTTALQIIVNSTLVGLRQFSLYNLCRFLPQLFYLVGLWIAFVASDFDYITAVAAQIIGGIVSLLVLLPSFIERVKGSIGAFRDVLKAIVAFALRATPADLLRTFGAYADRLLLVPLIPVAALGYYAVAYSLSRVVVMIMPAINGVLLPKLAGSPPQVAKEHHDRVLRFMILALTGIGLVLIVLSKPMLLLVYGADFLPMVSLFRILILDAIFFSLGSITIQLYTALGRPGLASSIQAISFGTLVVLLLLLAPRYGAEGAAWGLMISSLVRFMLLIGGMKVRLGLSLPRICLDRADFVYLKSRLL